MDVTVSPAQVEEIVVSGLLAELDADLLVRYPGEPTNGIDVSEFRASGGMFFMARIGSQAAGCGAFRPLDQATVEIKRMFTSPQFRGRGIARAVLQALETEARRRGYTRSVLETGVRQPEAIALYRSCDYAEIELFGPYIGSAHSVCFGKEL